MNEFEKLVDIIRLFRKSRNIEKAGSDFEFLAKILFDLASLDDIGKLKNLLKEKMMKGVGPKEHFKGEFNAN